MIEAGLCMSGLSESRQGKKEAGKVGKRKTVVARGKREGDDETREICLIGDFLLRLALQHHWNAPCTLKPSLSPNGPE
jgi:hypothetical protein